MTNYLQAIATILSLVNPAICAAMFLQIETGRPKRLQVADATKSAVAVLAILAVAALAGTWLLHVFGVSLDAFQVAGGSVLVWMGFLMLRGPQSQTAAVEGKASPNDKTALARLILFAASPGTITGVITLSVAHTPRALPVTSLWTEMDDPATATEFDGFSLFGERHLGDNWRLMAGFDRLNRTPDSQDLSFNRIHGGIGYDLGHSNILLFDLDRRSWDDDARSDDTRFQVVMQVSF